MLILSILHNIFISPEQARQLNNQETVDVVGVSLPVWYYKGITSEPAEELFCQYTLKNDDNDQAVLVKDSKDGYIIHLPKTPKDYIPKEPLSDEEWRKLSPTEQNEWHFKNPIPMTAKNLLPIQEGGGEYLFFRKQDKVKIKQREITAVHAVEIKYMSRLIDSFN